MADAILLDTSQLRAQESQTGPCIERPFGQADAGGVGSNSVRQFGSSNALGSGMPVDAWTDTPTSARPPLAQRGIHTGNFARCRQVLCGSRNEEKVFDQPAQLGGDSHRRD